MSSTNRLCSQAEEKQISWELDSLIILLIVGPFTLKTPDELMVGLQVNEFTCSSILPTDKDMISVKSASTATYDLFLKNLTCVRI